MRNIDAITGIGRALKAVMLAAAVAFVCGCPKKDEPPAQDPSSPESYMNDTNFMGRLSKERAKHVALIRERNAVTAKMKEMIEAKKAELKTDDIGAVKAALEKDPAWMELYAQCTNANAKVEAHSRERLGIVRGRIAPGGGRGGQNGDKPVSKRERGAKQ